MREEGVGDDGEGVREGRRTLIWRLLAVRSTINTRVLLSSIFFMADSGERGKEGERQGRRVGGKEGSGGSFYVSESRQIS